MILTALSIEIILVMIFYKLGILQKSKRLICTLYRYVSSMKIEESLDEFAHLFHVYESR